jgi:crossover junction endonuclease EME1
MPEIISLVSSPPSSPPKQRHGGTHPSPSPALAKNIFDIGSDDFNFTGLSGDFEFPTSQARKKRKLSPSEGEVALPPKPAEIQIYTISDDDDPPLPHGSTRKSNKSAGTQWDGLVSDPIGFSSSAPEPRATNYGKATIFDLSEDLPEDIMPLGDSFSLSQPTTSGHGRKHLSERTANLLAGLSTKPSKMGSKGRGYDTTKKKSDRGVYAEDIFSSSPTSKTTSKTAKSLNGRDVTKEVRALERAAAKAAKAAKDKEREEEKERKRLVKEQKAKEKQEAADIAEVNKSKTDKRVSVSEMIVGMSRSLEGTSIGNQVLECLKLVEVEVAFFEEEDDLLRDTEVAQYPGNLVVWRRKVKARYNDDAGQWEPLAEERIEKEPHIMVHLTATDFAGLVSLGAGSNGQESTMSEEAMTENIDRHVSCLRRRYKDCKPIYLIEGLEAFLRKNKTVKNRAYTAAVLSQRPPGDPSALPDSSQVRARKTKKKKTSKAPTAPDYSFIDSDLAESLLLHLQLRHSVLIHHTATPSDTTFWIRTFTEHISTVPYRHVRMSLNDAGAAFCMDVGQVKTGEDARDTYVKMLQEVQRVTPAMAYGIANLYPNVRALVQAFREEGPLVLEDVRKGANRDGAVTDSRLGPAVSKRLYKVFMGKNEWSTDGIA